MLLNLTRDEAKVLLTLLWNVGGDQTVTCRKEAGSIEKKLRKILPDYTVPLLFRHKREGKPFITFNGCLYFTKYSRKAILGE